MARINLGKVMIGGVLAGAIIFISQGILNILILGDQYAAVMQLFGLPEPPSSVFAVYFLMALILGSLAVWVYAAIRPRFGAGPRTAMIAGIVAWSFYYGLGVMNQVTQGIWPLSGLVITAIWGLLEMILATTLGARFYSEPSST
jgi:hypothetical protein